MTTVAVTVYVKPADAKEVALSLHREASVCDDEATDFAKAKDEGRKELCEYVAGMLRKVASEFVAASVMPVPKDAAEHRMTILLKDTQQALVESGQAVTEAFNEILVLKADLKSARDALALNTNLALNAHTLQHDEIVDLKAELAAIREAAEAVLAAKERVPCWSCFFLTWRGFCSKRNMKPDFKQPCDQGEKDVRG